MICSHKKKWVFTFSLLKIQQNVVATHVALSLPVVTVKEKKNPIIQFVGCCPLQKTELF